MIKKLSAAIAATALIAASPAIAQAGAQPLAVAPAAETVEGGSALDDQRGASFYIIAAVVVGLAIWGIWELVDDEDSESP